MTKARDQIRLLAKGQEALTARVSAELKPADDVGWVEQFLEAERIVVRYLETIDEGSTLLPDPQELAFACALLLISTQTLLASDVELLGRLNAPALGVSMFSISGQIADMKARAIAGLEKLATADPGAQSSPPLDTMAEGDVPF